MKILHYYFVNEELNNEHISQIRGFSHASYPRQSLTSLETLHIDLTEDEEQIFSSIHKKNRKQIREAFEKELTCVILNEPTDRELEDFQQFYNIFAKTKPTHKCSFYHMKTLKLLRNKKGIVISYIESSDKKKLCYRVYVTDHSHAMTLYSVSHFRLTRNPAEKRLLSMANRLLLWRSIQYFKQTGHSIFDMGGLTNDPNIRNFKLGFGGKVVPVYSGYESYSLLGKLLLKIRHWKISHV